MQISRIGLVGVPLVVMVVLFIVPIMLMAIQSVQTTGADGTPRWSLEIYGELLADPLQWRGLANTFGLAALVTVLSAILGYPIAYAIVRGPASLRAPLFIIVIAPLLISLVARAFGWLILLSDEGIYDKILQALGLVSADAQLLFTFPAVLAGLIHVQLPYMVLSVTTGLADLDESLEEAAQSLGANRIRTFLSVTLPLSARGILAGSVIVFGLTIGSYAMPALLGGGKIRVTGMDIYDQVFIMGNWSYASALAIVLLLATFALTALASVALRKRRPA